MRTKISFVITGLLGFVTLVAYQNCGMNELASNGIFARQIDDRFTDFPVSTEMKYFGYMSCNTGNPFDHSAQEYFTFKLATDKDIVAQNDSGNNFNHYPFGISLSPNVIDSALSQAENRGQLFSFENELNNILSNTVHRDTGGTAITPQLAIINREFNGNMAAKSQFGLVLKTPLVQGASLRYDDVVGELSSQVLQSVNGANVLDTAALRNAIIPKSYNRYLEGQLDFRSLNAESFDKFKYDVNESNGSFTLAIGYDVFNADPDVVRSPENHIDSLDKGIYGSTIDVFINRGSIGTPYENIVSGLVEYEGLYQNTTQRVAKNTRSSMAKNWSCFKSLTIVKPQDVYSSGCFNENENRPKTICESFGANSAAECDSVAFLRSFSSTFNAEYFSMRALLAGADGNLSSSRWLTNNNRTCLIHDSYSLPEGQRTNGCYGQSGQFVQYSSAGLPNNWIRPHRLTLCGASISGI
ncbi:MAG: hypothetical protein AB8E15_03960 [Bdellovibrionales bacterium]